MFPLMIWVIISSLILATFLPANSSGQLPSRPITAVEVGVSDAERPPIYMIQVRKPAHMLSARPEEVEEWHRSFLPSPALDSGEPRMIFSYKTVMSGFAARLTAEEVKAVETKEGFVRAQLDEELIPQTTHSPDFLGLRPEVWDAANRGKGAIIGVIDSGIDYGHLSFVGSVIEAPPDGWKGSCYFKQRAACNDKILGATFLQIFSPSDEGGHGSHVAGTAAGVPVSWVNVRGDEIGTAAGAAPEAYLSIYRASTTCQILWSIERAIEDGVHIISISLSTPIKKDSGLYANAIAKGALEAVRRGILVVCAACNGGPMPGTVCNDAPWIMTVGASTMGRILTYILQLSNGQQEIIQGESLYVGELSKKGLVFPGANDQADAMVCKNLDGALNVANKVVMCYTGDISSAEKAEVVKNAGGIAMILLNTQLKGSVVIDVPDADIPVVAVSYTDGQLLINYARNPSAVIDLIPGVTSFDAGPYPAVPAFSGRGPSLDNGGILKPDILGPGVNILSANATGGFIFNSGTSMATPHLSGIAAILKLYLSKETGFGWNPAMVRSAIMTTAFSSNNLNGPITDEKGDRASLFAIGAGHVHPAAAMDPGLVYDIPVVDYVRYLCGLDYNNEQMFAIVDMTFNCRHPRMRIDPEELNYPSIMVTLDARSTSKSKSKTIKRTLMSVLSKRSKYTAELSFRTARNIDVRVSPETLEFSGLRDNKTFDVIFSLNGQRPQENFDVEGHLRWVSEKKERTVSSPFLVRVLKQASAA